MKVVIIGGVAGGASAAARIRRLDETAEIVLFERGEQVSFANCGLPYHLGEVITQREALLVAKPERFRGPMGVDLRLRHEVLAIDPAAHTLTVRNLATGETHPESYDKLLLAPGSSPLRPPLPGIEDPAIFQLWTMRDLDALKARIDGGARRAVVVGGGFIGLEVVENLRHRGLETTLVELLPQLLPPLDAEMTTPLNAELERHGVQLLLGTAVSGFRRPGTGSELEIDLKDGRTLAADVVVLAIGVRPNSELAKGAGLRVGDRGGIVVNGRMQTSDPDIYAVGDAVQVLDPVLGVPTQVPLAGPANRQGRLAADAICGRAGEEYRGTWGTAVVKLFGVTAASTGASEKALRRAGVAYEKIYLHPYSHATYYPGAAQMHLKVLFNRAGRLLGAQAVGGEGVDKRIDVLATALQAGLPVTALASLELAYAPPYGSAKDPVNFAGFVAANLLQGETRLAQVDALPANALLLDVREPAEFAAGSIPGAVLIPLGQLRARLGELPRDRDIVTYCAVGIRGYLAERILRQNGFPVWNLSGGIKTWQLFHPVRSPQPPAGPGGATSCGAPAAAAGAPPPAQCAATPAATVDARGLQCPGPIVSVKQALDALAPGQQLRVLASDRGFLRDLPSFCQSTGHALLSLRESPEGLVGLVAKGVPPGMAAGLPAAAAQGRKKTTLVLFSNDLDRALAALIIANGFAALGHEVNIFCTFWGLTLLRKDAPPPLKKGLLDRMFGWMLPRGPRHLALSQLHVLGAGTLLMKQVMAHKGAPSLPALLAQARQLGVKLLACEMAMNVMGLQPAELLDGVELAGVANFAALSEASGTTLFI